MSADDSNEVALRLTRDQAIVLFEWLSREDDKKSLPIVHHAEQIVLWKLEAQLESTLVEPLLPNYHVIVGDARRRVSPET
jgi:hypothetical protein